MSNNDFLGVSLRKIAKGAGIGFVGTLIGMTFGFLSRMIIARFLGASDYGLISLGFGMMTVVVGTSMIGLPVGIQRYVSFYKGKGDDGRIKGTILGALKLSFPISLFLTFIIFFYADWISINFFNEPSLIPVLRIFSIAIPFYVLALVFIFVTIGFQDMRFSVYVNDIFQNVFKLIAIVSLVGLGFGVVGAAWGWVLAIILMPFLAFYFLEKKVFPILKIKVKAISMEKELFTFSFPLIFAGLAGIIYGWTDTFMLGYFSTASDVGIYNVALPTAKMLSVFLGSFGVIFMPVVSELYSKNAIEDLRNTYNVVTKWIFSLVLPVFLLMVLFSEWILGIMFGEEYIVGSTALCILAFGYLIICVVGPASEVLQTYGKTKILMWCSFFGAFLNFGLNYLFIPLYGIKGAAIATGVSIALISVLHLFFVYKIANIQPFRTTYFKPLFASLISVLVVYGITKYIMGVSVFALISMFFVFLILYFLLLLLLKSFEEEDIMIMMVIDQRLGIKSDWIRKIIKRFI